MLHHIQPGPIGATQEACDVSDDGDIITSCRAASFRSLAAPWV